MYFIGGWDVVILQEQSQIPSVAEEVICHWSYPYAKILSEEIHNNNPNAKVQWFLTWGRANGATGWLCDNWPNTCTYEGMQDKLTQTYTTYGCMFPPGQVAPVS